MRHLAAFVLILLLVVFPSCKYFKGRGLFGRKADTMAVWHARQDSLQSCRFNKKSSDQLMAIENAKLDSARKADAGETGMGEQIQI